MNIPTSLLYTKSHEWVEKLSPTTARIGITDYAQDQLGDLVYVNLPEVGDETMMNEVFSDVESVKAVSDIYCPVTGTVTAINESVMDTPEAINKDPYEAWFVEVSDITEFEELMDSAAYTEFCENAE